MARIGSVCWVACASVCDRVAREKSSKRSRSTTVRHTRRAPRSRRARRSTSPTTTASRASGRSAPAAERALRAHRAPAAADLDRPRVAVVGEGVELAARRPPDHRHQRGLGEPRDLADARDPALAQLVGGDRAHAPQPLDRQQVQEGELAAGRHHEQAVGLGHAAGHLGEELRPRHADRDRQADPLEDLAAQAHGDVHRRPRDPAHPADVEEGLVDREPLDQRRRVGEDLEDRLARLRVGRHPRADHDRVRAQPSRRRAAHRRAHAVRLGLVARREHDPATDDDRPAAQARARRAARPTRRTSRGRHAGS